MEVKKFILDVLDSQQKTLTTALDGLSYEELTWRPGTEANSIGFILWHQTRDEDYIQAMIQHQSQVWINEKWYAKFRMSDNPNEDGYGYTAEQVAAFIVPELKDLLLYFENTRAQTVKFLHSITADEIDRVIQTPFWGDLSIGQIFTSFLGEVIQHTGQIAYLRGLQRGIDK
jgi:hypothetical protein